jgi:hypothetical protein
MSNEQQMKEALEAIAYWLTPDRFNSNGRVYDTWIPGGDLELVLKALGR